MEVAEKWMVIADIDGSGTVDLAEFTEFLTKIEATEKMDEAQIKEIFEEIDTDGNGELSTEEFGSAIFKAFTGEEEE